MKAKYKGKKTESQIAYENQLINDTVYLCTIAMCRAYGIGKKRLPKFTNELNDVCDWFRDLKENVDNDVAHVKLAELMTMVTGDYYFCPKKDEKY